jgi:hypothetical protein
MIRLFFIFSKTCQSTVKTVLMKSPFYSDFFYFVRSFHVYLPKRVCVFSFAYLHVCHWVTRWRSWLRHCATSRKVAGSIPYGVNGILHWHNPSSPTMALELTEPLNRNKYQEYFLWCEGGRCVGLKTLPPSCADCLEIWEPQPPGTLRVCPDLKWDCFTSDLRHHRKLTVII